MNIKSYRNDPLLRTIKSEHDLETLIDAYNELEWTCPECLYRNDDSGGNVWEGHGDWRREEDIDLYCGECGRQQDFHVEWSPSFSPLPMRSRKGEK